MEFIVMQIFTRTINIDDNEKDEILIALNVRQGVGIIIDNHGPGTIDIKDVGIILPNRFIVIGSAGEVKIKSTGGPSSVEVSVFTT
jgi:hypothetical protein